MASDEPPVNQPLGWSALDDADAPLFTIGQTCALLGVQAALLRRLDEKGIVSPERSQGGQRRYSRNDMNRLREVLELTGEGVTLPGVRKVLDLRQRVADLETQLASRPPEESSDP